MLTGVHLGRPSRQVLDHGRPPEPCGARSPSELSRTSRPAAARHARTLSPLAGCGSSTAHTARAAGKLAAGGRPSVAALAPAAGGVEQPWSPSRAPAPLLDSTHATVRSPGASNRRAPTPAQQPARACPHARRRHRRCHGACSRCSPPRAQQDPPAPPSADMAMATEPPMPPAQPAAPPAPSAPRRTARAARPECGQYARPPPRACQA